MNMSLIWAIIVGVILMLIIYGIISSKMSAAKIKTEMEKSLQNGDDKILTGAIYDFHLRSGKKMPAMILIGRVTPVEVQSAYAGWEGMIILKNGNGKKIFVKQSEIRMLEEV